MISIVIFNIIDKRFNQFKKWIKNNLEFIEVEYKDYDGFTVKSYVSKSLVEKVKNGYMLCN